MLLIHHFFLLAEISTTSTTLHSKAGPILQGHVCLPPNRRPATKAYRLRVPMPHVWQGVQSALNASQPHPAVPRMRGEARLSAMWETSVAARAS